MAKTQQLGLRLSPEEAQALKRVAEDEGRSEPEIARESIRIYVRMHDEMKAYVESVERGWYELQCGLGSTEEGHERLVEDLKREVAI